MALPPLFLAALRVETHAGTCTAGHVGTQALHTQWSPRTPSSLLLALCHHTRSCSHSYAHCSHCAHAPLSPPQECAYPQAHAHAHVLVLCPPACGHIHAPMLTPCSPIQHPHAHTPPRHLLTPPGHRHALSRRRHAHAHPGHLRLSNSPAHSPHPLTPLLHTLEQHCGSLLPTLPVYPPPWAHARIRVSLCAFAGHTRAHVCTLQRSLPLRSSTRPHCTVSHTARNRNPEDAKGSARRGVCVAS